MQCVRREGLGEEAWGSAGVGGQLGEVKQKRQGWQGRVSGCGAGGQSAGVGDAGGQVL